ncbi:MAG: LysR substrate-binding domain-containing protein [Celeribacter sp.]|jgi:DNA-binding transcriptional LysR family regulator
MDLGLLADFLELARELNFSRAAEGRNLTQPAFSRRIRNLEDAIGTPLVTRTTRAVALTPAGQAFQPRAAALVRAYAEARKAALEAAGSAEVSLNLAATHALSYTFVPQWLMQVSTPARFGSLNMVSDSHRQCTRLMLRGDATFFICHRGLDDSDSFPDRQFSHHVIGADRLVPLCAPGKDGQPRWRLGAAEVPFIAYGAASGLHAILNAYWASHGRPKFATRMHSVLAATNLEMAREGQGVAYLPLSLAQQALEAGELLRAAEEPRDVPVEIVIYRPRSRLSPHCEAFWARATAH